MTQKQLYDTKKNIKNHHIMHTDQVFILLTPPLKQCEYINTMESADTN